MRSARLLPLASGAALLFGSGLSALIYQTAWQREFRLIFGSSTAASAAVLTIFIRGLGGGGRFLAPPAPRAGPPAPPTLWPRCPGPVLTNEGPSPQGHRPRRARRRPRRKPPPPRRAGSSSRPRRRSALRSS